MENNTKLLSYIHKNAAMGTRSIPQVLSLPQSGAMRRALNTQLKEYKKIGVAQVVSAVPVTDGQKQKIEKKLLDTTHYETMEIDYKVDESLIGGLMIRIGDRVVDSTIKNKLGKLTASLMKISLESEKEGVQAS